MKSLLYGVIAGLLLSQAGFAVARAESPDLRSAVPQEAFMAVYGMPNPERDYQKQYFDEIWKTAKETQVLDRLMKIMTEQAPADELAQAKAVFQELQDAASPIDLEALGNCKGMVYAQVMRIPSSQHLVLMSLTSDSAASTAEGVKNLFSLIEKYTQGEATVETTQEGDAEIVALAFSEQQVPFAPALIKLDDVLIFSTSKDLAKQSLKMLTSGEGESKFDDPRLKEALGKLPEAEDSITFFDGRAMFDSMRGFAGFIRQVSNGDPEAEKVASLLEEVMDEFAVIDYEVTVEYTDGYLNRSASYGKLTDDAEGKTLTKMLGHGQPFQEWQKWVPAGAVSYNLNTGVYLHPLYERAMEIVKERFPEAEQTLADFAEFQEKIGVNIDEDILQAFSGETVSVSIPPAVPSIFGSPDTFTAMRCQKPERVKELLHRMVDAMQEIPQLQAQQLKLVESEELEGFEELSAIALAPLGAKPVIGFHDGWMIIGSNVQAVKRIMETQSGEGETIDQTDAFKQFGIEIDGAVSSVSYSNLAESTRGLARFLNQMGMMAPMIIGMAGANADPEDLKPVQDVMALLPDVARIVSKFDFMEAQMTVIQGVGPNTYMKRSAIKIRAPQPENIEKKADTL